MTTTPYDDTVDYIPIGSELESVAEATISSPKATESQDQGPTKSPYEVGPGITTESADMAQTQSPIFDSKGNDSGVDNVARIFKSCANSLFAQV